MKPGKILGALALGTLSMGCRNISTTAPNLAAEFFVATNGNDGWTGRRPEAAKSDGPFATPARALEAAQEFRRANTNAPASTIWLAGGTFFLPARLKLTPEDSGITLAARPGARPVLSGGRKITGWREGECNGRKVWRADVAEARGGNWSFRELWVNGHRAIRARLPNTGYLQVAAVPEARPDVPWMQGQSRFGFATGEFPAVAHPKDAEVLVMTRWVESRLPVVQVDSAERWLRFGKRSTYKLDAGDPWYAEGAQEFLDAPGEWVLDPREGRIYYAPLPGERLATVEAIAPVLPQLLTLEGELAAGRKVERVVFRGITFAHAEWQIPSDAQAAQAAAMTWPAPVNEIGGFGQAAVGVPGAVRGQGARSCRFERCAFVHLGSYGLELGEGCQSNVISQCEFADLGAGGIKIGETAIRRNAAEQAQANEIADCQLHDGGKLFQSAVGIWIGQSPNNRITHNRIHDFYYTGISIGWTWGYGPALATNNLVEWNHIHHIGGLSDGDGPVLSDLGGIYTLGMQPGTRIVNNLWHDIAGLRYGGWGIYFDEGSSRIVAENNLVYRTTHGGFHQHYGATNVMRNNVFAFARHHQIQRSRDEAHVSFIFTNNLVEFDEGVLLGGNWKNDRHVLDANLYWDARPEANADEMQFAGATLEAWRARGHDRDSLVADPLFVSPRQGDFRLKPNSPALRRGFHPVDLRGVGPRP